MKKKKSERQKEEPWRPKKLKKLNKKDFLMMAMLMLAYGCIAFFNLGDRKAPETFYPVEGKNNTVVLDFGKSTYFSKMAYYLGNYENRNFLLEIAQEEEGPYQSVMKLTMKSVFAWGVQELGIKGQYLRLTSYDRKSSVGELIFYDFDGNMVKPVYSVPETAALFDEQTLFDGRRSYHNGTYFDEIYHARTAYEYMQGLYSYENTHPPLGKILISFGIRMFGMNPFGWRFMGTLFGILMIPAFYILALKMFGSRFVAALAGVLFSFDFMHFTQTRIATIDVFVTFFIILMYLFMYFYIREEKKKWLLCCGISMGLGIACKWTGIYAGAGLAVLFFIHLWMRYRNHEDKKEIRREIVRTCLYCLLFFLLIPAAIYTLSYLPFRDGGEGGLIFRMLKNQQTMFNYHTGIDATHPYSSWWYQWPTMYRPIWYYSGTVSETLKEGISAFGNPLVWWAGIPAFFCCAYAVFRRKDRKAFFLCIGYLSQYLPWIFVTRITFIYHYFPSVPFVVLMIAYVMSRILKVKGVPCRKYLIGYTAAAVFMFFLFYPVLSGWPVTENYAAHFLRWFDSWVLL